MRPEHFPRLVTSPSHGVTQVTARYPGLVGDPALCWNSTDRRGIEPAHRGRNAAPSGGEKGEPAPVTHDHHGGRIQAPHDADTVPPSRGGTPGPEVATLVQGRFKRDGSASAEPEPHGGTDRGLAPARPERRAAPSGDGGERARRSGASASAGAAGPTATPTAKPPGARRGTGSADGAAQLAHLHASGLPARPPGGRGHHARRPAHQRLHGRHPAAGPHEAADRDDQAGDRAGRRAPGGARPVGRPPVARRQGDRLHGQGPRDKTDRPRQEALRGRRRHRRGQQGRQPRRASATACVGQVARSSATSSNIRKDAYDAEDNPTQTVDRTTS